MFEAEKQLLAAARERFKLVRGREWFVAGAGAFESGAHLLVAQAAHTGVVAHEKLSPVMCGGRDEWSRRDVLLRQLREQVAA
jgi:hypothetical protein